MKRSISRDIDLITSAARRLSLYIGLTQSRPSVDVPDRALWHRTPAVGAVVRSAPQSDEAQRAVSKPPNREEETLTKPVAGIMLVCALAVGLGGCASSDEEPKVSTSIQTSPTAEKSTAPETEAAVELELEEGASQQAALDTYVEMERAELEKTDPQLLEMYSDITVEGVDPGTVAFSYTYADELDPALAAEQFDLIASDLQELCDTQVFPAMKRVGVTDSLQVAYTYFNVDGSVIWSKTFSPS